MKKAIEFIKRNTFLIGVGVLVLAGLVTIVGLFLPQRKANAAEVARLEGKQQSLSQYASKADLHNEADVPAAGDLAKTYEASLDEMRAQLASQGQPLDEPLKEQPGNIPATDGSIWKLVYSQDVDNLLTSLQRSFLIVGDNPVVAQQYGDEIPNAKEIQTQTRYLHVQQLIIGAIAKLNSPADRAVPVFNGFTFLSQPERLLSTAHSTEFTPIPFQVRLSTDFTNIPRVLHSLLQSPVQVEITSISISRPDRLDRGAPGKKAWAARTERARTAPTRVASATPARVPAAQPSPSAAPMGTGAPSAEMLQAWQEAAAKQQQEMMAAATANVGIAAEAARRAAETARGYGPSAQPSGTQPTAARRPTAARTAKGTEVTEEIKAQLPKTLVDVTIRGYVADYKPQQQKTAAR